MQSAQNAINVLETTRQHVATLIGQVQDFHARFEQLVGTAQQRQQVIEQNYNDLLQHVQEERNRAEGEKQHAIQMMNETATWMTQEYGTLSGAAKVLEQDYSRSESGFDTLVADLQQHLDSLAQTSSKAVSDLSNLGQHVQGDVDHAHEQAQQTLLAAVETAREGLSAASEKAVQSVNQSLDHDLAAEQTDFQGQLKQLGETASALLSKRGETLHTDIAHDVDSLTSEQSREHQDLVAKLATLKDELTQLGTLLSSDGKDLAHDADNATKLMQETNVGLDAVIDIIQNVETIFQDIISMM